VHRIVTTRCSASDNLVQADTTTVLFRSQRTARGKQTSTYTFHICSPVCVYVCVCVCVCVCVSVSICHIRSPVNTVEQTQVSRKKNFEVTYRRHLQDRGLKQYFLHYCSQGCQWSHKLSERHIKSLLNCARNLNTPATPGWVFKGRMWPTIRLYGRPRCESRRSKRPFTVRINDTACCITSTKRQQTADWGVDVAYFAHSTLLSVIRRLVPRYARN